MMAPDPAVPRRDALLRPETLAAVLGIAPRRCERLFVKYRFGESLRVAHRLDDRIVSARAGRDGFEMWEFPDDRRLTTLATLASLGPLVAYEPEKSATAAIFEGGEIVAYAKATGDERRGLEHAAGLDVPRILATEPLLKIEAIRGRRLDGGGAARAAAGEAARVAGGDVHALGAALARLHQLAPPRERFTRFDDARLATAADVIGRAVPGAAEAAERLLAFLLERRDDARGELVCLHGDANLRNAIRRPDGRVALLDLEHMAAGPAAADLGQVLALRQPSHELLAGYATVAPPPSAAALRWHTAAAVLTRVVLPGVNRVRPEILARARVVLEAAA